jgi:hypothetical protein
MTFGMCFIRKRSGPTAFGIEKCLWIDKANLFTRRLDSPYAVKASFPTVPPSTLTINSLVNVSIKFSHVAKKVENLENWKRSTFPIT